MILSTRNILKKDNRRKLKERVFDNLQSTMNSFSEALYFLHVEIMVCLDHYKMDITEGEDVVVEVRSSTF